MKRPLSPIEFEVLSNLQARRDATAHGQKAAALTEAAAVLGCNEKTVYRKLREAGLAAPRRQRKDWGESEVQFSHLKLLSGMVTASSNKKEQHMPLNLATDILKTQGLLPHVSAETFSRQLQRFRMSARQMAAPSASLQMRSPHENAVWQGDATTGAYYYLPGGRLRWMPEDEFYKNKVENLVKASTDLLTRYCIADHTSHAFKVRYYLGGETAANLLDFLCWAMSKQPASPMHGVPFMLVMDPGAANKGLLLRNFCKRLGIKLRHHAAGAARVTGSVEKAHDLVRMHYETRLRFVDPTSVTLDMLNRDIETWTAAYCTKKIHSRHKLSRYAKWMQIKPEQLRVPSSEQALREAAHKQPEPHRVQNDRTITFGKPVRRYRLDLVPGATPATKVMVVQNLFRAPAIDVLYVDPHTGGETWHTVEPIELDSNGYDVNAPMWGQEMRVARNTDIDERRNAFMKDAYRTPGGELPTLEAAALARRRHAQAYAGVIDVMADVKATQVPTYMPRRSVLLDAAERQVEVPRLNTVEACKRLREGLARLGLAEAYDAKAMFAWVNQRFGEAGMPEDQVDGLCEQLAAQHMTDHPVAAAPTGGAQGLRIVGGGQ